MSSFISVATTSAIVVVGSGGDVVLLLVVVVVAVVAAALLLLLPWAVVAADVSVGVTGTETTGRARAAP